MTLADVAAAVGGVLEGDPAAVVTGAAIDSRTVAPGDLFVALVGERSDGHDHAAQAVADGATAVLAQRPVGVPVVLVDDPAAAMARLARASLERRPDLVVVGVTGSSGKTTTKDLIAHVLAAAGPVHANPGSFNNELGLPLTVLRTPPDARHLVLEYGARGPGHIATLMAIAMPRIAVELNVGSAHLGEFGSVEVLAAAKAELVAGPGVAVLNADDERVRVMVTQRRVVLAGESAGADVLVTDVVLDDQGRAGFTLTGVDDAARVQLRLVGRHMVGNAAAAAAVGLEAGLSVAQVAERLSSAEPASRWRMEVTERPDGVTVINDAYNANPQSMAAALRSLAVVGAGRRTWAVLGEMAELGEHSVEAHAGIGRLLAELGVAEVLLVGSDTGGLAQLPGRRAGDVETALDLLRAEVRTGDVLLVKASRSIGLERVALGLLVETGQGEVL